MALSDASSDDITAGDRLPVGGEHILDRSGVDCAPQKFDAGLWACERDRHCSTRPLRREVVAGGIASAEWREGHSANIAGEYARWLGGASRPGKRFSTDGEGLTNTLPGIRGPRSQVFQRGRREGIDNECRSAPHSGKEGDCRDAAESF